MKTIQAKMHSSVSWAVFTGLAALCLFQGKNLAVDLPAVDGNGTESFL